MTVDVSRTQPEEKLAQELRALRSQRGWSQQDLARHMSDEYGLRWHQTTIAKIEAGQRPIGLNEAAALADVFQITGTQLLTPVAARPDEIWELEAHEQQLVDASVSLEAELAETIKEQQQAAVRALTLEQNWRAASVTVAKLAEQLNDLTTQLAEARAAQEDLTAEMVKAREAVAKAETAISSVRDRHLFVKSDLAAIRVRRRTSTLGTYSDVTAPDDELLQCAQDAKTWTFTIKAAGTGHSAASKRSRSPQTQSDVAVPVVFVKTGPAINSPEDAKPYLEYLAGKVAKHLKTAHDSKVDVQVVWGSATFDSCAALLLRKTDRSDAPYIAAIPKCDCRE